VVIDTLAHDGTLWDTNGNKLVSFGGQGVLDGQFNFPNSVAVDDRSRMFITDTDNGRVQVWGWPEQTNPVPLPSTPWQWAWCLAPLLLLPLLLLWRRKTFFATADFLDELLDDRERPDVLTFGRKRWLVTEADHERYVGRRYADLDLGMLLEPTPYSESDAAALVSRFEIPESTAAVLAVAQRAKFFCTQDPELRRLARSLEIDVMNVDEAIERFGDPKHGAIE
jgi:hypothetical protein